jgi:hypothetical protein
MKGEAGKMWLFAKGGKQSSWMEQTGIPFLDDLTRAQPNDCVVIVGKLSHVYEGHRERRSSTSFITPWLLNERSELVARLDRIEIERRLRREGLPVHVESDAYEGQRITVTVWGLDAIEMRRVYPSAGQFNGIKHGGEFAKRANFPVDHTIWKPAERMATRAIYILGLDFGQVDLILSDTGRLKVADISPVMLTAGEEGSQRLARFVSAFANEWTRETMNGVQATLGADPEFILLSPEGKVVPASRYFSPEGAAGCDSIRIHGEKRWPLVELRPRPSSEPSAVTAEVRRLLDVAAKLTAGDPLSWRAGASPVRGLPLGGHLHVSGMTLTSERLRAFDNVVALPLRLLEPPSAAARRPRYGALGDVRRQPHGGFEYRTPPSWLVSPRLTLGVLALAKVAAEHARELSSERPLDEDRYRDAFYEGDRTLLLQAVEKIYQAIARTRGYANYRQPIDFVFDAISRHRSWDESADIRLKWRIPIP